MKTSTPFYEIEKVLPILNKISILGGLNEKQLYLIFRMLKHVDCEVGEMIFKKGDPPSHIYIILSGEVKIFADKEHMTLELITYTQGHCFGQTSVIGIQPHLTSAMAVKKTELIVLERSALFSIYEKDKELFSLLILNIARETCRQLKMEEEHFFSYILKNGDSD